jgi:dihydrofolate reductase
VARVRRIVNSTYVTLDGVIEDPQDWPLLGSLTEEGNQLQKALLDRCDAVLMGRRTYEVFAAVWPGLAGDPFADRINALPKYVVSTTLADPEWSHTTVISRDPVEAVRELRRAPGTDIVQYGFGPLSHALMAAGMLDELRLWVHPFVLGSGTNTLLHRTGSAGRFALTDVMTLGSGVVVLTYTAS